MQSKSSGRGTTVSHTKMLQLIYALVKSKSFHAMWITQYYDAPDKEIAVEGGINDVPKKSFTERGLEDYWPGIFSDFGFLPGIVKR